MKKLGLLLTAGLILLHPALIRAQSEPYQPSARGVVIVIGGVGGMDLLASTVFTALPRAGVTHEIREFNWTHGKGKPLTDLRDTLHLRQKAEELADLVRLLKAENPNRPVFLLAKSGGTGLALRTAELLPANTLERIVLLAAAVSPGYDLRRALQATRGEIVCFYSSHDQLILNFGTRNFGTIDRVYGPAAGLHGFKLPTPGMSDADHDLYRRLVQIPWTSRNLLELNNGTHMGSAFPAFLGAEVAPWLR
jgi:pimeloyl-ACP methyl ester carboxylesterase